MTSLRCVANCVRRIIRPTSLTFGPNPTTSAAVRSLHQHEQRGDQSQNKNAVEVQKRFIRDLCAQAESGSINSALSAFRDTTGRWESVPDWAVLKFASSVARLDVEGAKKLLKDHQKKTSNIYMRQRTFHKDQVPTLLENLLRNEENGFMKAKELYATLVELKLYKRKNECAELFIQYHLIRNDLDAAIRELTESSEQYKSCLGLLPVLVEIAHSNDQERLEKVCSCAEKFSTPFQVRSTWLYALLENGKTEEAELFLQKNNTELSGELVDFVNFQAIQRRKPKVFDALLKMHKLKESVILRENVLIGMAKTYMKLHDPQGLKSVWKMLMAEDIILFSKAIGSIRDYFRRLNLAPPEVDEKKICIQPHHR